jgi:hypothetical protein
VEGSLMTGNRCIRRTIVYAASVRAKSTYETCQPCNQCARDLSPVALTSQADPRSSIEWQITPFSIRRIAIQRHVLVPSFGAKALGVHSVKVWSAMHSIHGICNSRALRDKHRRFAIRATTGR